MGQYQYESHLFIHWSSINFLRRFLLFHLLKPAVDHIPRWPREWLRQLNDMRQHLRLLRTFVHPRAIAIHLLFQASQHQEPQKFKKQNPTSSSSRQVRIPIRLQLGWDVEICPKFQRRVLRAGVRFSEDEVTLIHQQFPTLLQVPSRIHQLVQQIEVLLKIHNGIRAKHSYGIRGETSSTLIISSTWSIEFDHSMWSGCMWNLCGMYVELVSRMAILGLIPSSTSCRLRHRDQIQVHRFCQGPTSHPTSRTWN